MERVKLTKAEIDERLSLLHGWTADGDVLKKRLEFGNFAESLAFVNKVCAIAEAADHHPDMTFGWGYVEIAFTTHDRGGITDVDFALSEMIDKIERH
ncbi:MAG: 4a-hydroxytetrahydrobiopterin dehydratase [Acidobacteriota bacterium]